VQARFQGRSASTALQQTNVLNNESSQAPPRNIRPTSRTSDGGTLSGVALTAIVGGAATGGIVGLRALTGARDPLDSGRTYTGTYSAQAIDLRSRDGFQDCSIPFKVTGTIRIDLNGEASNNVLRGTIAIQESWDSIGLCQFGDAAVATNASAVPAHAAGSVDGTRESLNNQSNLTFDLERFFNGAYRNGTIVGGYRLTRRAYTAVTPPIRGHMHVNIPVELR
jgi:hypothetical protein